MTAIHRLSGTIASHGRRWVIYLRQSKDHMNAKTRVTSESIKSQEDSCRAEILRHDPHPESITVLVDQNRSAKRGMTRPGRDQLIGLIKSGEVNAVMAYKVTRLARDIGEGEEIWQTAAAHSAMFMTTEGHDLADPLLRGLLFGMAARDNKERSEYSMNSLLSRHARGLCPIKGDSAYGLVWEGETLVANTEELKVVEFIYQQYDNGKSMAEIGRELSARNAPRRGGRTDQWDTGAVSGILKSQWYLGYVPNGLGGEWNAGRAFLDPKLISRVHQRARDYKATPRQMHYPLSGLLYCGVCRGESPMTVCYSRPPGSDKTYLRYRCVHRIHNRELCSGNSVGAEPIERFILAAARQITGSDEVANLRFARRQQEKAEAMTDDAAICDQQIAAFEAERARLFALVKNGFNLEAMPEFNADVERIAVGIRDAEAEKARLVANAALSQQVTQQLLNDLAGENQLDEERFLALPPARRARFYRALFPNGLWINDKVATPKRTKGAPKLTRRERDDQRAWARVEWRDGE